MAITRREAQGAHFLTPCASHILFLYLVLVLPFTRILERKIQPSGDHAITPLLFSINYQPLGAYHLAKVMSKYSQKILGQHIIPSVYRHIIIAMIKLTMHLDIDEKSGGFTPISIPDFDAEMGALQAHHSKSLFLLILVFYSW